MRDTSLVGGACSKLGLGPQNAQRQQRLQIPIAMSTLLHIVWPCLTVLCSQNRIYRNHSKPTKDVTPPKIHRRLKRFLAFSVVCIYRVSTAPSTKVPTASLALNLEQVCALFLIFLSIVYRAHWILGNGISDV